MAARDLPSGDQGRPARKGQAKRPGSSAGRAPAVAEAGPGEPLLLEQGLQYAKGVGPKRAELLERLLLRKVRDLLYFFPVEHIDRAQVTPIAQVRGEAPVNIRAQIIDCRGKRLGSGKEVVEALLADGSGQISAVWWNPYVARKLTPHAWGFFSGKLAHFLGKRQLNAPEFEILAAGRPNDRQPPDGELKSPTDFGRIIPLYSLRPRVRRPDGSEPPEIKLNQSFLRRLVWEWLERGAAEELREDLPEQVRSRRALPGLAQAIRAIHFPESMAARDEARRRLAYEELFLLSVGVALLRARLERQQTSQRLPLGANIRKRILARLPFQLTPGQERAFSEIAADAALPRPMNRLLQGDVGCGKTAVAVAAMLLAVAHRAQAAFLAPTEVLAEQHLHTLRGLLQGSQVRIELLRGGTGAAERAVFLKDLAAGLIHIAVGTHALLEPQIVFQSLALVVVDEQHKFGVEQRRAIRDKGRQPHVLVMTATPIPRTLSLTLYGDLDLSVIEGLPPGRVPVLTRWLQDEDRPKLYEFLRESARKGLASYVVLPRIEEGAQDEPGAEGPDGGAAQRAREAGAAQASLFPVAEVKGVERELERLRKQLPELRIEGLHGRMRGEEKDRVLGLLRAGQVDILVSTQVIEVGVDLSNAGVVVIENGERFGLASLHQLRGRVGRSAAVRKPCCFFFAEPANEETRKRLKAFEKTRSGFEVAELDFELRGPGQFFGTDQSGLPEFLIADLQRDRTLLDEARADAFALVREDPVLGRPEHANLRARVKEVLGKRLGLLDVG